jgi:GH25 family lysozyme M1 (1,4-beta-N-acetylmuramidase)
MSTVGPDFASVDGNHVDWNTLKRWAAFVFLRSNYSTVVDPDFAVAWKAAEDLDIPRGAYGFLVYPRHGVTPPSPESQAKAWIKTLENNGGLRPFKDYPFTLDIEMPGAGIVETGLTADQAIAWTLRAWTVLEDHWGVPPIAYTSQHEQRDNFRNADPGRLIESLLWLAGYPPIGTTAVLDPATVSALPQPPTPVRWYMSTPESIGMHPDPHLWWVHQYQGDARGISGISRQADLNRFHLMSSGETGLRVRQIQRRLGITETDIYDAATVSAVREAQRIHGQQDDGIIGPRTLPIIAWSIGVEAPLLPGAA